MGERVGSWELLDAVACGGAAIVYRAVHEATRVEAALKMLRPVDASDADLRRRFLRETRTLQRLSHPNIVRYLDSGETEEGVPWLVTEYVRGETLRALLSREGPLAEPRALWMASQIAAALEAAHRAGVLHRDLKPDNVMLDAETGTVRVLDFGLARRTAPDSSTLSRTKPGTILGSVHYLSPEQARGSQVDARADIWSLGAVLYEMLAGSPPFQGETCMDVLVAIVERPAPPVPRTTSSQAAAVVAQCLSRDPAARFPNAAALREAIERALARSEGPAWRARLRRWLRFGRR